MKMRKRSERLKKLSGLLLLCCMLLCMALCTGVNAEAAQTVREDTTFMNIKQWRAGNASCIEFDALVNTLGSKYVDVYRSEPSVKNGGELKRLDRFQVMGAVWNVIDQVGISSGIFPVLPDDVFLSVLPLSHTYECSIGMIYPFSMGARVVYLDRPPTASALMPALRAVRPSVMLIVPLIIEKIYRHQVLAKFNSNGFWRTLYKVGFLRRYQQRIGLVSLFSADEGILVYHLILCLGNFPSAKDRQQDSTKMPVWYCISYGFLVCYPYSEIQCIL